jgi:thiosulfate dehydrogenase
MRTVIALCAAIGALTVVATVVIGHKTPIAATPEYGKRLLARTQEYLGPDAADPRMRFTASRRACASCHLDAGAESGELSLIAAVSHHPNDIVDRINECMTRNMNGRPLPVDGVEMIAMVSWMQFLSGKDAATGPSLRKDHDPPQFKAPDREANPKAGEQVFAQRCADCHGKDGAGLVASRNPAQGYVFPPLWGSDSFTDRSEMHSIPTAARFVKAKMPLGRPDLDDDQAFDVAAFINSRPRPHLQSPL